MKTFRENLRSELNFQGLTVKELSAKTGIVKGTLDNYLGVRSSIPPADIAVKIASALNVSVEYLVTGIEKNRKSYTRTISIEENSMLFEFSKLPKNIQNTFRLLIHQTADSLEK